VRTLADLRGVSREAVAALDELDPAERRMLWHFVTSHQPAETFAMASAKGKASGTGKSKPPPKLEPGKVGAPVKGGVKAGTKDEKGKAAAGGKGECSGTLLDGGGDYRRHWTDEAACFGFVFRADLPDDAFSVIAKQLFN